MSASQPSIPSSARDALDSRHIVLIGGSLTGNRGAESMLRAAVERLAEELPGARFTLLSLYPDEDRAENDLPNLEIVPFSPLSLLTRALPFALATAVADKLRIEPRVLPRSVRAIRSADAVIDLSGVSFVDGRGTAVLVYNCLSTLIPWFVGTPSIKYAQAMGPFRGRLNRALARLVLPLNARVIARGDVTRSFLDELGLDPSKVALASDAAFAMGITPAAQEAVRPLLEHPVFERPVVAVSASSVVHAYCRETGKDYVGLMARFIEHLVDEGYGVVLVAHSLRPGKKSEKNNDEPVCDAIFGALSATRWVLYPDRPLHADALRVLIGACRFLVASRFHAMISGLAMGVPSMLLGWSHKYAEVLAAFGLERFAMDYKDLSYEKLLAAFERLVAEEAEVRESIARALPDVIEASVENARVAADVIRQGA